jgi:hypothetical protein
MQSHNNMCSHDKEVGERWRSKLLDDASDDEDEERRRLTTRRLMAVTAMAATASFLIIDDDHGVRSPMYTRDRVEWDKHVAQLLSEGDVAFQRMYRMSQPSFLKLCNMIRPLLQINEVMSRRCTGKGPITAEMALHCLLRFLSGGSPLDARLCVGISIPSFYRIVFRCVDAILRLNELAYHFPSSPDEILKASCGFAEISSHSVIEGCVGALDGMLLRILTPRRSETGNVKAYFSGHYQDYGINVQAVCDSNCRFIYAALAAPGGANDIAAYRSITLPEMIEKLPLGNYVLGDNAYVCSEHLLTPFPGDEKKEGVKDVYNFYLSQCRIRIEMTFGRLVNKWRIFRRPLQLKLSNTAKLFLCATRLHNYCIDEWLDGNNTEGDGTTGGLFAEEALDFLPSNTLAVNNVRGNSMMRDFLVEKVASNNLRRPIYNTERNQEVQR